MAHEDLIRGIFDDIINRGDLDAADRYMTEDYVDHGPMGAIDLQTFKGVIAMYRGGFPDLHCAVEGVFSDGDMVAWLVRVTGTHTGELMGIPPSGNSIELLSANIGRIRDGRAAEHWSDQSLFQLMSQIGAIPAPAA